jgi:hypothetical protein
VYVAEKIVGVSDKARSRQVQPQNQQQEQARRRSSSPSDTIENDSFGEGSDDDTFGVSTLGDSTYNDPTKEEEPGGGGDNWALIGNAVTMGMASLGGVGGLFGVAALAASAAPSQTTEEENGGTTNGGSTRSLVTEEEERSIETDGDNDTYGESTMQSTQYTGTQYTGRTDDGSEDDWLGYMRNIIYPKDDVSFIISLLYSKRAFIY